MQTRRPKTRDCTGNSDLSELNTALRMNRLERPNSSISRMSSEKIKDLFYASQSNSEFMSAVDQIRQPIDGCSVDRLAPTNNRKGTVEFEKETRFSSNGPRKFDSQDTQSPVEGFGDVGRERPSRKVRKEATPKFHTPSEKRNSSVSRSTNGASFIGNQTYSLFLADVLKSKDLSAIAIKNDRIGDDEKDDMRYGIVQ